MIVPTRVCRRAQARTFNADWSARYSAPFAATTAAAEITAAAAEYLSTVFTRSSILKVASLKSQRQVASGASTVAFWFRCACADRVIACDDPCPDRQTSPRWRFVKKALEAWSAFRSAHSSGPVSQLYQCAGYGIYLRVPFRRTKWNLKAVSAPAAAYAASNATCQGVLRLLWSCARCGICANFVWAASLIARVRHVRTDRCGHRTANCDGAETHNADNASGRICRITL